MDTIAQSLMQRLADVTMKSDDFIPLHAPEFSGSEWAMVKDCLDTGWVSSVGSYVDHFEREVAELCGVAHGVAMVNGTASLQIALEVAGVKPSDEVILPTMTFIATANAIHHARAVPHFADSDPVTLGLDVDALEAHLERIAVRETRGLVNSETGARISAIVPMHTFGHPTDMDKLNELASRYGIVIVEDAAEALGSKYKGRACGGLGHIAALSFNGNKIVTTGGGGAIVTNDSELAKRAKHLSTTAKVAHAWAFTHDEVGYNYRMPNINAALGCAQLEQLPDRVKRKRILAERYFASFEDFDHGSIFREPAECESNYWLNTLILSNKAAENRDGLLDALNRSGFQCRPIWSLLHKQDVYKNCPRASLPAAENLERRIINLPSSAILGKA
jgi:perosamine synthetase